MRARRNGFSWMLLTLGLALTVGACSPPEEEIEAAEVALEEARTAEAPTYAATEWQEAQEAYESAQDEIDTQQEKSFVGRRFGAARELLSQAAEKARAATSAAAEEKGRVRDEARGALEAAQQGLADVRILLDELAECPRQPKGFANDLELMRGQVDALEIEFQSAQQQLDGDSLYSAVDRANAVQEQIDALSAELMAAKERIGC